jgi:hypothetical protein
VSTTARLPYGIYAGDVVKVDAARKIMTFRVRDACSKPKAGVFSVPLDRATFLVQRGDPSSGPTDEVTLADWARAAHEDPSYEVDYFADDLTVTNGPTAWCDR